MNTLTLATARAAAIDAAFSLFISVAEMPLGFRPPSSPASDPSHDAALSLLFSLWLRWKDMIYIEREREKEGREREHAMNKEAFEVQLSIIG